VLLAAEARIAIRASHDLSRCLRTGWLHELSAGTLLAEADESTVITMSGAAGPTRPLRFQSALIAVAVTLVLAAGRNGCEISPRDRGRCLDAGGRSHTLTGQRWWIDVYSSGRVRSVERERLTRRKESVSLPGLRSGPTCGNGGWHSGSQGFADTEEDGGSTPPAPTVPLDQQFSFAEDFSPTTVWETGGVRAHGGRRTLH
jgi:hypothetical protein